MRIYSWGDSLPPLPAASFFHSPELFHIVGNSSGQTPYMLVVTDDSGTVMANMLAILRRRLTWFPPFIYTQGRVYGEGVYANSKDRDALFGLMVHELASKLRKKLCLYIEFSNLSRKMFGYRVLRNEGFFPVSWQEVHNSLHSLAPEERLSQKMRERIQKSYSQGVETREAASDEEIHSFYKLLKGFYRLKPRRYIPNEDHFLQLGKSENGRVFITLYKGKIIGGSACVFSEGNAYMWYLASRRKRFRRLHPDAVSVWKAIDWAWKHNYAHIFFLDVGLPFPFMQINKNPFREFILSFGGKPVSKYRWFCLNVFPCITSRMPWLC